MSQVGRPLHCSDDLHSNIDYYAEYLVPLQSLITNPNPQLSIPAGRSKSSLLGFYDCALSEKKRLRIKYLFKGREHLVEVDDKIGIALPLRGE
jgi:DnaJ family protein C protein 11